MKSLNLCSFGLSLGRPVFCVNSILSCNRRMFQTKGIAVSGWEFYRKRMELLGDSYINFCARTVAAFEIVNSTNERRCLDLFSNEGIAESALRNGLGGLVKSMKNEEIRESNVQLLLKLS